MRLGEQQKVGAHGRTFAPFESVTGKSSLCDRRNKEVRCLIRSSIMRTRGGLLVWHVRDYRIWSCRKPPLARLEQGHLWATTRSLKDTKCQRTVTLPPRYPLLTSTRTYLTPGCLCGCRCTASGSVQPSPAPTSKDACITFWKGRQAGNASCITSQCECFYFHNHPHPLGIQGYNCNSKILIKQGVNCACRALEVLTTKNC